MPNDRREARAETFLLRQWGVPGAEAADDQHETALLWLTGGACLLLWTALAFLLTAA